MRFGGLGVLGLMILGSGEGSRYEVSVREKWFGAQLAFTGCEPWRQQLRKCRMRIKSTVRIRHWVLMDR